MVILSIKADFKEVQRMLKDLPDKVGKQATARALNRSVEAAKTDMNRQIRNEFNIDAATVRSELKIERASFFGGRLILQAALYAGGGKRRGLNLIRFLKGLPGRKAKGVRSQLAFAIKKGGAKPFPGAFIGNKGKTVFVRIGKDRLPIRALSTIGVPQMFNTRRINSVVVKNIKDKFPAIFEREAAYYLSRYKA